MNTKIIEINTKKSLAEIFAFYHNDPDAVFLDSSLQNEYGRYSIVGLAPYLKAEEIEGNFFLNGMKQKENFTEWLRKYLKEHKEVNKTSLPLISGGIGYFTYDFGRKFVGISSRHQPELIMPDALLIFYSLLIIEDGKEGKIFAAIYDQNGAKKLDELHALLKNNTQTPVIEFFPSQKIQLQFDFEKNEYLDAIDTMIDYIIVGDIYIANMTQQLFIKSSTPPFAVFNKLRKENPSPFGGYFNYGDFQIVSASPERFLKVIDKKIETRPIKGTRKRGRNKSEDELFRKELELSEKDKSELLMIVDLERNDLNRICKPNTVEVTELFAVEAYATVFHLVSTIKGSLREDTGLADVLEATFPGGSITGAPKHRAMEIIDELEHSRRGLYTGSIGYVAFDGACDFNIVIRTAIYQNGIYHFGIGGGITYESDLQFEYEETLQKAKAFIHALEKIGKDFI